MDLMHAFWLALVQGLTEFLPISSSAHLILAPWLLGWKDQSLAFDVAVHLGTLLAVMGYFRREVRDMTGASIHALRTRRMNRNARLGLGIAVATIPAALAGLMFGHFIELELREPVVIAWATILFALGLWWADVFSDEADEENKLRWHGFLMIGLAQAFALIPGASRSGMTMMAALMLGMSREAAARVSFLTAIPIILLAGGYELQKLLTAAEPAPWDALAVGTLVSFVSAYATIHYFLKLVNRVGFLPFVIYRLLLGAFILTVY